ncbi:hypothetical protein BKA93DRAFT_566260 [Sparassis latifolia]
MLDEHGSYSCWNIAETIAKHKVAELERKRASVPATNSVKPRPQPRLRNRGEPDVDAIQELRPTRITRQMALRNTRSSPSAVVEAEELILVYPPAEKYLNDTLIEFGLKLWLNELRENHPELAEDVYVFSSFFYKKLNIKNKAEGYQSVRKWTSKFDIFKKKYVIVPINEHFHWWLAIIYNPEHILNPPPPTPIKSVTRKRKREQSQAKAAEASTSIENESASRHASPSVDAITVDDSEAEQEVVEVLFERTSISDRADQPQRFPSETSREELGKETHFEIGDLMYPGSDDAVPMDVDEPSPQPHPLEDIPVTEVVVDDDVEIKSADSSTFVADNDERRSVPPSRFYGGASGSTKTEEGEDDNLGTEQLTYIFTFDSLGGRHPQAANTLSTYLQMEAKDKKGLENTSRAKGKVAHVPDQKNFSDCGGYLLHFVRTFMSDPVHFAEIIINGRPRDFSADMRKEIWHAKEAGNFRENLKDRILALSETWKEDRVAKEDQKAKGSAEGITTPAESVIPESDDEIEVGEVEVVSRPPPSKTKSGGRGRGKGGVEKDDVQIGPAARLR